MRAIFESRSMFFEWLLGGVILGVVTALLTFGVASAVIRLIAGPVRRDTGFEPVLATDKLRPPDDR